MESVRKRMSLELVSSEKRIKKLINRSTFKYCTHYNENLSAVSLHNKIIKFDKPIYIGFAVLDISKTLMYDYHYNTMKQHYKGNINLMYTDTGMYFVIIIIIFIILTFMIIISDSLVYHVKTDDFYNDLLNNPDLLARMDLSNLPRDHPCYDATRKKVPGLFSDETDGRAIYEFVALRAKSYAYNIEGIEKITAKGIRRHVVKNHMTLEHHKMCLFGPDEITNDEHPAYTNNISIRSYKHQVKTIKCSKLTYNSFDNKRVTCQNRIHTVAHGHYRIA